MISRCVRYVALICVVVFTEFTSTENSLPFVFENTKRIVL